MARRKNQTTEDTDSMEDLAQDPDVEVVPVPKPRRVPPSIRKIKKVTFSVWATRRQVKNHHQGGMRAFIKNPNVSRSMESWDAAFADY